MLRAVRSVLWTLPLCIPLAACDEDSGLSWVRFNDEGDTVEVEITDEDTLGDPVVADLHSTTGATILGTVTVDPGSGPVGTEHLVVVSLEEDYAEQVRRVDLTVDSGDRGVSDFELEQDSADRGKWVVPLTSYGVEGEERTDELTITLFSVEDADLPDDSDVAG